VLRLHRDAGGAGSANLLQHCTSRTSQVAIAQIAVIPA